MKILSSEVQMEAETTNYFEVNVQSSLEFKQMILGVASPTQNVEDADIEPVKDYQEAEQTFKVKNHESDLAPFERISKNILELILERFFPERNLKMHPQKEKIEDNTAELEKKLVVKREFSFERTIEYIKKDSIEFSSKAVIKTEDKDIEIDLNLSYSKEFHEKHKESLKFEEIAFLDPLVINYEGSSNALDNVSEDMTFMFDLDADGKEDELPLLKNGNGFLVIDKNGNGEIDDGTELFGPQTNDGFNELRAYDSDGNNWIDENDEIFNDLRIWTKNENGEDSLIGLGQSGVGALFLSDIASSFTHNKSVDESIAHLKSTSIFLKEDGTAGLLTSLDFIA